MNSSTKLILAASMPRSGSTWLFNVARELILCQDGARENFSSGWIGDWGKIEKKPLMLIKVHEPQPALLNRAAFIFYSYRDLRDVLASLYRKFQSTPTIELAGSLVAQYDQWTEVAGFVMKYEDMDRHKLSIINDLAIALGCGEVDAERILGKVEGLSFDGGEEELYDSNSLYHRGHITDGRHGSWEGVLSPEFEAQVVSQHREWFVKAGYENDI